jgi:hypothetical protein
MARIHHNPGHNLRYSLLLVNDKVRGSTLFPQTYISAFWPYSGNFGAGHRSHP